MSDIRAAQPSSVQSLRKKKWVFWGIGIFILIIFAIGAPKASDFFTVQGVLNQVKGLEAKGNFQTALAALQYVEEKWMPGSTKEAVNKMEAQEKSYIDDQNNFDAAIKAEDSGDLDSAQKSMQAISSDFPAYGKVQIELANVNAKLAVQLQNEAQQAKDEAAVAKAEKAAADAKAAQAAQDKAQAQAEAAAAAQAQAQANMEAEQQAAAAAAAQAEKTHQVLLSFYNQLSSAFSALSSGISYYNDAMSYYNNGSFLAAIAGFGQAQSSFQQAYRDAGAINTTFSGMPANYVSAGYAMASAANACLQAANDMIQNSGAGFDVADPGSAQNTCDSEKSSVSLFLTTTNP